MSQFFCLSLPAQCECCHFFLLIFILHKLCFVFSVFYHPLSFSLFLPFFLFCFIHVINLLSFSLSSFVFLSFYLSIFLFFYFSFLISFFLSLILSFCLTFLSVFLPNSFLCWDHWNGDMMTMIDAALLCSSRAGSDLGHECIEGLLL